MSTAIFVQLFMSGLTMGALYALTAKGLFIAHLATGRMNFGQGEFLMIAAYISMALLLAGVPVILVAIVVVGALALLGWGLERLALRPLDRLKSLAGGQYSWVLTTMGVALILQNVATLVWGKSSQYSPPLSLDPGSSELSFANCVKSPPARTFLSRSSALASSCFFSASDLLVVLTRMCRTCARSGVRKLSMEELYAARNCASVTCMVASTLA